jgi:hypothetical protein
MSVTLASQKSGMRGRRGKPVMVVEMDRSRVWSFLSKLRVYITPRGATRTSSNAVTLHVSPFSYLEGING